MKMTGVAIAVLAVAFCCSLYPGVEARAGMLEDGGMSKALNAENILEQFGSMLPAGAHATLESHAAPARRRLLAAKKSAPNPAAAACAASFGTTGMATVVLVADPGTFAGVAEGTFYEYNLKKEGVVKDTFCVARSHGMLAGVPVVLASTGIGSVAATICLAEILLCASQIKEILYSGTAGWTPQVGGLLDTDDCSKAQPAREITRLGDVCISPYSMNFNCKLADYANQVVGAPDLCSNPQEIAGPSANYLYGDCVFATPDPKSSALSKKVFAAVKNAKSHMPNRSTKVSTYEKLFWDLAKTSMKTNYTYSATKAATVWSDDVCMEVDSQFFYSGNPYDQVARQYVSDSLSGNTTNGYSGGIGKNVSRHEVIVVSAMEAVGVMELMTKFNANKKPAKKLGYVMIRGNSDYLVNPMEKDANGGWVYPANIPSADFTSGYAYAIATTSFTMMTYLRTQCEGHSCEFTIPYPKAIPGA